MSGNRAAYMSVNAFTGYEGKNATIVGIADAGDGSYFTGLDFTLENPDMNDAVVGKIKASSLRPFIQTHVYLYLSTRK